MHCQRFVLTRHCLLSIAVVCTHEAAAPPFARIAGLLLFLEVRFVGYFSTALFC